MSMSCIISPFAVTLFLIIQRTVSFIRVNIKSAAMTFVNFSAFCEDFCMKVYAPVKQSNMHFMTMFG